MDLACFVSCFSAAVPSRLASVLRHMSVRTSMLLPFPPFLFLFGPLSPLFGPCWGVRFALRQDALQFVTTRALENGAQFALAVHFLASSSCLSPFVFLRALSGLHVSGTPQVRPQSLLHRAPPPGYFCLLSFAARPTVRAPVLLSAQPHLRLRHQRRAQHGFPHSSWLSSVLALVSLSAP